MSKAIEAMKEEGWEKDPIQGIKDIVYDYEYVYFRRPKQKPNAIVDWIELKNYLADLHLGNGFDLARVYPGVDATFQSIASDIERLIKKAP